MAEMVGPVAAQRQAEVGAYQGVGFTRPGRCAINKKGHGANLTTTAGFWQSYLRLLRLFVFVEVKHAAHQVFEAGTELELQLAYE